MESLNITQAKARLSAVVERVVSQGEEVIIERAGKPVAKIVRYEPAKSNRRLGFCEGKIKIAEDFDEWPDDIAGFLGMKDAE